MLVLKSNVRLHDLDPAIVVGLIAANEIFKEAGYDCIITSANDSTHGKRSLHPKGLALDFRSKHIKTKSEKFTILALIKHCLDVQFDIILEGLGTPNEHYHMEYDPK